MSFRVKNGERKAEHGGRLPGFFLCVERLRGVVKQLNECRLYGVAAEIAFFELVGLVPFLGLMVQLVSLLPRKGILETGLSSLSVVLPPQALRMIDTWLQGVADPARVSLVSAGALIWLWVGSAGIAAFVSAFDVIFHAHSERRPFLHRAVIRISFTILGAVGILTVLCTHIILPPIFETYLTSWGLISLWKVIWIIIRIPVLLVLVSGGFCVFYHFLSPLQGTWKEHFPGALLGTVLFLTASLGFGWYVRRVGDFDAVYGGMGALVIFLFWLQFLNLSVLIGASWNAQGREMRNRISASPRNAPRYRPPV